MEFLEIDTSTAQHDKIYQRLKVKKSPNFNK